MTTDDFDWASYVGAYGSAAAVPDELVAARKLEDVDALSDALAQIAKVGIDNDYLTEAASPLAALLIQEALGASGTGRGQAYLRQLLRLVCAGQNRVGVAQPATYFSPVDSEKKRVTEAWQSWHRRAQVLEELKATMPNWLPASPHVTTQFGIPQFRLEIAHLCSPTVQLERVLLQPWPGEVRPSSAFSWLLRPLSLEWQSAERQQAFAMLATRVLAEFNADEANAMLEATLRLPGYPCRELALAFCRDAATLEPLRPWSPPKMLEAFRELVGRTGHLSLREALCRLFEKRVGGE